MRPQALEVWGDPVAHSLSPALHTAAYRALGLAWSYGRRRVPEARFPRVLAWARDERMRGLSLTFPLKEAAAQAAGRRDEAARLTGAANTLLLERGGLVGANTDVGGLVDALAEAGYGGGPARIVGAGATARSALVALARLGAGEVDVVARRPEAVAVLHPLAALLGVDLDATGFGGPHAERAVTVSTLPGGAVVPDAAADALAAGGGTLVDVVYGHWPTSLAAAWARAGRPAHDGRGMLLHQAVRQVRLFVAGDAEKPLPGEESVVAAMRGALVGD